MALLGGKHSFTSENYASIFCCKQQSMELMSLCFAYEGFFFDFVKPLNSQLING